MSRAHCRSIVPAAARRAFTLIELLVVIAIIAMLIGIIMPSLGKARDQAKTVKTKTTMKAIGDSLDMFVGENEEECNGQNYPPSGGGSYYDDPTETGGAPDATTGQVALGSEQIFGCQWIVRYLMGKNLDGYVPKRNVPKCFDDVPHTDGDGWAQKLWYGSSADSDWPATTCGIDSLPRVGPYMSNPPIKPPRDLPGQPNNGKPRPDDHGTDPKYNNFVFVDVFGYPILYYAAKSGYGQRPDAVQTVYGDPSCAACTGIYNFRDNALFTGLTTQEPGAAPVAETGLEWWDFGSGPHKLTFGPAAWKTDTTTPPLQKKDIRKNLLSFAYLIMNKQAFETSYSTQGGGTDATKAFVAPVRRDSFILLSPGKDGVFGTGDDVMNW